MKYRDPQTLQGLKRELVGDSRDRERLLRKIIQLVRQDEREHVLRITDKARERAESR